MANKADAVSSQGPSSLWWTETRPYITQSWCKCLLEMRRSSRSSALVCFWSDFDGNYPPLNSKISHFTFTPAGNMTARSQRELSFPRHKHLRLTLCHQTSFTLWDQTRHLIVPHHITPEVGCELIICSIVRLSLVDFFPPFKEENTKGACAQQRKGGCRQCYGSSCQHLNTHLNKCSLLGCPWIFCRW